MKKVLLFIFLSINVLIAEQIDCKSFIQKTVGKDKNREVFIIVDQTTSFPKKIRKSSVINIFSILNPKTAANLFTFSEYSKDRYISFVDHYYFYSKLDDVQLYNFGKKEKKHFDQCWKAQDIGLKRKLANDIYEHFKEKNEIVKNSEIFFSLKELSKNAIKVSKTKEKIVFILSDMLENSNHTSFYKGELKKLDIEKEMKIVKEKKLLGDFDGADIIVVGAGLVDQENYRDGDDMIRLKEFWSEYFKLSNGNLKFFGTEITYPIVNMYEN
ncbi:MAG: hypothetical protein IBX44_10450 [Sulfurospirillum sp.]|nr:hypothetical protein [Sulfurospirillum sp.]